MGIRIMLLFLFIAAARTAMGQKDFFGKVLNGQTAVIGATVHSGGKHTLTDSTGVFHLSLATGKHMLTVTFSGFQMLRTTITVNEEDTIVHSFALTPSETALDAVVVSGTLRPVQRLQSPIPVEVYSAQFFRKNPTPSLFEGLQNINGVRPQINCSVCNTGDIHINGLEGPYTMVTIDGMPIVSSLSTVYGLFGIPSEMIERIEVIKGPASALYGSEAVGGLINVITKDANKAPRFAANVMHTTWAERSVDAAFKWGGKKWSLLTGANYYLYNNPIDKNKDGFTDVTLQHRVSVFNKFSLQRKLGRTASLAGRFFYEDRWGGEMNWDKQFRGGDSVYGESIYTRRWELLGSYDLPIQAPVQFSFSATGHNQNSFYGTTAYMAQQNIFFGQAVWRGRAAKQELLAGLATRYTFYNDNTTATFNARTGKEQPEKVFLPGVFIQDEWKINAAHTLLGSLRYDYHPRHKSILTPRFAYKFSPTSSTTFRLNGGTGFRVVNLFTEDHAALTGARTVEVIETLQPEKSKNININAMRKWSQNGASFLLDASLWYTHFSNRIIADYDSDPEKIIYANLKGYSVSRGGAINLDAVVQQWKASVGATLQDVFIQSGRGKTLPPLTERWSGTWSISRHFSALGLRADYTGNIYGPMRLPLISKLDPRPEYSPVWSLQNLQLTKTFRKGLEIYAGVKNILNWTPARQVPFLIARTNDPFDKEVKYNNGNVQPVADVSAGKGYNPYALTFDPNYIYAPNQGRRLFAGLRIVVQ